MARREVTRLNAPRQSSPGEHITTIEGVEYLVLKRNGLVYHVDRALLRTMLKELRQVADVTVGDLVEPYRTSFGKVAAMFGFLHSSETLYQAAMSDVLSAMSGVDPQPGTVGAYLVGCYSQKDFNGPQGCHPSCVGSLKPSDGTPGFFSHCPDLVLQYDMAAGTFNVLSESDSESESCYVHIKDQKLFSGFSPEDVAKLEGRGVKQVRLVFGLGSQKEYTEFIPLSSLQRRQERSPKRDLPTPETPSPASNLGYIVGGIFLLILILILLAIALS